MPYASDFGFSIEGQLPGRQWTDTPRSLTSEEMELMRRHIRGDTIDGMGSARLQAIKAYREMTDATLKAAVHFVDALRVVENARD